MISVVALIIVFYNMPYCNVDYSSLLVSVLSLLVTILVGWNIYTVIDFKAQIRKARRDYKKIEGSIKNSDQKAFDANISTNHALYQFYSNNKQYAGAVTSLIIALANMIQIDLAENNKAGNITRFSTYLDNSYKSMIKENQQFGENNIRIIEKNMGIICSNEGYHFIESLFKDTFDEIKNTIAKEKQTQI